MRETQLAISQSFFVLSFSNLNADGPGPRWCYWYFQDGVIDRGVADPKEFWKKYGLPDDMRGKKFYDLGCWDGGTCFEETHRGATDVYALDCYVWELWPQVYENFCLARDCIAPNVVDIAVETEPVLQRMLLPTSKLIPNKYQLSGFASKYGTADVVLAAGIVYHLLDPIKFLKGSY